MLSSVGGVCSYVLSTSYMFVSFFVEYSFHSGKEKEVPSESSFALYVLNYDYDPYSYIPLRIWIFESSVSLIERGIKLLHENNRTPSRNKSENHTWALLAFHTKHIANDV